MAQVRYFPTGSLSSKQRSGEFRAKWYSEQLKLSKNLRWGSPQRRKKLNRIGFFGCERSTIPSLYGLTSTPTALPGSQRKSRVVLVDKLIENDTMALTKEQTDWFLREIEGNKFWQLPSIQETPGGCDGSGVGHSGNQELVLPLGGSMDTKRRRSPRHRIGDDERVGQTKSAC